MKVFFLILAVVMSLEPIQDHKEKLGFPNLSSVELFSGCHQLLPSKPSVCIGVTKNPQNAGIFFDPNCTAGESMCAC